MKKYCIFALTCVFVCAASASHAVILEDFQFEDNDGTALNAAVNSANVGNNWIHDTDHAATIQVQSGSLNIVKNNTDFVTEGLGFADVSTGKLWMVAEFKNWAILGTAPDVDNTEQIRFGFMATEDLVPPPSSTVLAEMQINRDFATNTLQLSGAALGAAGTTIAPVNINLVQNDPFTMVLEIDQDTDKYSIHYKDGANPYVSLGPGNLEPTRNAFVVRMLINNFIGDETGEFANLDRFYISTTNPIPEPTTMGLLLLGLVGVAGRRQRS